MPAIYKASPFALLLLKQQSIFKTKQGRKFEQKPEVIYIFNLAFKLESKLTAQVFFYLFYVNIGFLTLDGSQFIFR